MNVLGIIFANDGTLDALTNKRATAALPFGGRYRQVDFALSNLTCAGIRSVGILTRHNYQSLMNHIGSGEEWGLEMDAGGLEFLTPYAMSIEDSYRGKLESLYSIRDFLSLNTEDEYIILTGSAILANVDMEAVLESHIASGKDITVVTKTGIANGIKPLDMAIRLDDNGEVADIAVDYAAPHDYLASMDIFVLSKNWLIQQVREHIARNLYHMDRDLVLGLWQKNAITINIYPFEGVALYNETLVEYFNNSLSLIQPEIRKDLFSGNHPVFTKVRDRVPSYYGDNCHIENCTVADGCMLEGTVRNSILFRQVSVGTGSEIENCVIMNDTVIGENCQLRCVILDKDVIVRPGSQLIGTPNNPIVIRRGEVV